MGYKKIIVYGNVVEYFEYEREINEYALSKAKSSRRSRNLVLDLPVADTINKRAKKRRDSVQRCSTAFKRLVTANLAESPYPVLVTLTHRENITDRKSAFANFNTFARVARSVWGSSIKYIAVPELQRRGSIHFHALFWGIPHQQRVVAEERSKRVVAGMWGQGFIDLKLTDGNEKLSTYLAKYMAKAFVNTDFFLLQGICGF